MPLTDSHIRTSLDDFYHPTYVMLFRICTSVLGFDDTLDIPESVELFYFPNLVGMISTSSNITK